MKKGLRMGVLAGVLTVFALLAASVSAGGNARTESAVKANDESGATVKVNVVINRFVRQGRRIVAQGAVVARYKSEQRGPMLASKPFTARLLTGRTSFAASQRICNVLRLSLGPLHLEVLGLIIDSTAYCSRSGRTRRAVYWAASSVGSPAKVPPLRRRSSRRLRGR
jgi:hypothetical protein